jgi:membrane protein EpsK
VGQRASATLCSLARQSRKRETGILSSTETLSPNFRKQFPKNLISNILLFFVNLFIGIWLVPYYIRNLGVAAYGLIPLATSLTQYVALFTMALGGGTSRFLTIDLQQGDMTRANRTFNTAFWGLTGLSLILAPCLVALSWYAPTLFQIPQEHIGASRWLFAGVSLTFLVTTVFATFGVSTYATNRLDCRNLVQLSNILVRTILVVLLFKTFSASLGSVALSMLAGAVVSATVSWYFCRRLTPGLHLKPAYFDRSRMGDLMGMGGWMVVNHIGYLLFLQIDLIVINRLLGPVAGGEYASVLQWNTLIRSTAGVLSGALGPMLMIRYAQNRYEELERLSSLSVKLLGLALGLPIGLACGFSKPLLTLWLGPKFSQLAPLMQIMLIHLVINLSVLPLFNINVCYNKIRFPGLVTLAMGGLNLILAISLGSPDRLGIYGVAIAGGVVLTLKNAFFTPWYAAKVQGIPGNRYFSSIGPGFLASLFLIFTARLGDHLVRISSWSSLVTVGLLLTLPYCLLTWLFFLEPSEKQVLVSLLRFREKSSQ